MGRSPPCSVAIVGAGWLGRALAETLTEPVLATSRRGTWEGTAPPHVQLAAADLTDDALDTTAIARATAIVVAVAPGTGGRRGPEAERTRHALYVDGTRRLLSRLPSDRRVVFVGSTSALPDRDAWLDEGCAEVPATARGRTQRAAEDVVLAHGPRTVVLRMGGLFGPGRELDRIYRNRDPDALRPGDGMAPTNLIHRDDAVAALRAALGRPTVTGIVHCVADGHVPRRTMYAQIATNTGVAPPQWSDPAGDGPPRGKRVSNLRLKLELGVRLRHPMPGA